MSLKWKFNALNILKIWKVKNLVFYWFIKLKRLNFEKNLILNKLPIVKTFKLFLKEFHYTNENLFKKLIYNWNLQWFHNKLFYLKYFRCFFFLSKKLFPFRFKWKVMWSLLWLWNNGIMKWKLSQLRFSYLKRFYPLKWKKNNKFIYYFLTKQGYHSKINLYHLDIFKLKKNVFFRLKKTYFFLKENFKNLSISKTNFKKHKNLILLKNKFNKFKNTRNTYFLSKNILSKSISIWFKTLYLNLKFYKKIKKYFKYFKFFSIKKDSFKRLYKFENLYLFESLIFWKSIINLSENAFSFLSEKVIFPYNLLKVLNFFEKKNVIQTNIKFYEKFVGLFINFSYILNKGGFGSLWHFFFEKLLEIFENFFSSSLSFFDKNIIYIYYDIIQQQSTYLPTNIWIKLLKIINRIYTNSSIVTSNNNKNLTLKIFDNLFLLFFKFSVSKFLILETKNWNLVSHTYEKYPLYPKKNWSFLNFFSKSFLKTTLKKKLKNNITFILKKKYFFDKIFFFKFYSKRYFIKKKKWKYLFDASKYLFIHRYPTPTNFLKNSILWWFFFTKNYLKLWWARFWRNRGDEKISYDVVSNLHVRFWSNFFFLKSTTDKLLSYAFYFRNGLNSLNLIWSFTINYFGKIKFTTFPNKLIFIGKKWFDWDWKLDDSFSEYKNNDLFFSFFSFLSWTYLLNYMLQFGHTVSTYNTTYKNFILMVYNKRFILNLLALQLNLKWNLRVLFKMFYLGGSICLVSSFNILIEGLVSLYGAYAKQPYTRYLWVNGLISNFDKIFKSIKVKLAKAYSGKIFLTWKSLRRLLRLWFCSKGILNNLSIDISFFPSMRTSYWVFLENCARFYPTISNTNTSSFVAPIHLDYFIISNDYSLLSLSFYINLLILSFKKAKLLWKVEFSVYPQKLISEFTKYQILSIWSIFWLNELKRQFWKIYIFFRNPKFLFLDYTWDNLSLFFKYYFIFWMKVLIENKKHVYWRYLNYFNLRKKTHFKN